MRAGEKMRGPDFLVIGAQRSGTTWVHRVLRQHPDLWLPPVKELHYFDKPMRGRTWLDPRERRRVRPTRLDLWHLRYLLGKRSDEWYARLFQKAQANGYIAGEITPSYAVVDHDAFCRMRRVNSAVKLVFVMRDPVERAWSEFNNRVKKGQVHGTVTPKKVLRVVHRPGIAASSAYFDTIERLEAVFSQQQLYFCFFDDLCNRPGRFAADLLKFLGADVSSLANIQFPPAVNVASDQKPPPGEIARALAAEYSPMVRRLGDRFGGAPLTWLKRYEALLDAESAATGEPSFAPIAGKVLS